MSMRKYITLSVLSLTLTAGKHRNKVLGTSAVKPKTVDVPMGVLFQPRDIEQRDELVSLRAIRLPVDGKDDLDMYREFKVDWKTTDDDSASLAPNAETIQGVGAADNTPNGETGSSNAGAAGATKSTEAKAPVARNKAAATKVKNAGKAGSDNNANTGNVDGNDANSGDAAGDAADVV